MSRSPGPCRSGRRDGLDEELGADCFAQDTISGDELISDSFDLKLVDGIVYEADCHKITIGGESFDTGANASAEGGDDDGGDEAKETVLDIVHSFRLQETSFDKKSYLGHLKSTDRPLILCTKSWR